MNCVLRHIGCNSIHVSDELRGNSASKSWRSQFMMRQHQFIHRKQTEQEYKDFFLVFLLFSVCNMGLGLAHSREPLKFYEFLRNPEARLTSQMRCLHFAQSINSPLRTSPIVRRVGFLHNINNYFSMTLKPIVFSSFWYAKILPLCFSTIAFAIESPMPKLPV